MNCHVDNDYSDSNISFFFVCFKWNFLLRYFDSFCMLKASKCIHCLAIFRSFSSLRFYFSLVHSTFFLTHSTWHDATGAYLIYCLFIRLFVSLYSDMHKDLCRGGSGLCDAMRPTKGADLLKYLRKVNFTGNFD